MSTGEPEGGSPNPPSNDKSEITQKDVYEIVTEKIIKLLEQGVVPWRKPCTSTGLPRNLVSKKPYRGINHFLLSASNYVSPFWLTMRQTNHVGGRVRKGEESTIVVFWKIEDVQQSSLCQSPGWRRSSASSKRSRLEAFAAHGPEIGRTNSGSFVERTTE